MKSSNPKSMRDLTIRGESIQRVFNYYINNQFIVNRRYQRKLVWSVDEKRSFIDSLIQGFPVPIILLAEVESEGSGVLFEIIDGMQRLNAVTSFIEGDFAHEGSYFDLNTMVESKSLLDSGSLAQKSPILDRKICEAIASYSLPLSVYKFEKNSQVDDVFRRINSGGRHLSRQELRAAGSLGEFAQLVRRLSSVVRGDVSAHDRLFLDAMKNISITSRDSDFGIPVEEIFWVQNNVLTKDQVRESRDEELIADIVAYMVSDSVPASRTEYLDEYFGFKEGQRQEEVERGVAKYGPQTLERYFTLVYDEIRRVLDTFDGSFESLVLGQNVQRVPRYFQVVFLAFYELLIKKGFEITDYAGLVNKLKEIGVKHINISGGGRWGAKEKEENIAAVVGIVAKCFSSRKGEDPAISDWITQFENLLTQSSTEQSMYDFKQGFFSLSNEPEFEVDTIEKIARTLTAIANVGPSGTGYVVVGVADRKEHAARIRELYGVEARSFHGKYIVGVGHEAGLKSFSIDDYFHWLLKQIEKAAIPDWFAKDLARQSRLIRYYDKDVLIFAAKSASEPVPFDGKFFVRNGPSVEEVSVAEYGRLFKRFA